MASIIRRLFPGCQKSSQNNGNELSSSNSDEVILDNSDEPDGPYIINSIYYLAIIFFIGVPMWFYTCSSTRYAIPDLTQLEHRLTSPPPNLQLDVSVIQFGSPHDNGNLEREERQEYLRTRLPKYFNTSIQDLVYNVNWRIRRPTVEENLLLESLRKENDSPSVSTAQRHTFHIKLETNLLKIHKPSNRFRLFIYIFDKSLGSLVCAKPGGYLINHERFIYVCPNGASKESTANLIESALSETYYDTVDQQRVKKILGAKTDLLVSLIPEVETISLNNLSMLADKVHKIFDQNVRSKYLELAGILNIRLITQNMFLLQENGLNKMLLKKLINKPDRTNLTEASENRVLNINDMGHFFHDYEARLNKHSSTSVHHVVTIVPDLEKPGLVFQPSVEQPSGVNIIEERDTNFILISDHDKSLVLGLRAIIRRVLGLKSANLCQNCAIRGDVFLNKWELDTIVGALIKLKLDNLLVSLRSIGQQAIGIKIPKYVSRKVFESHSLAHRALDHLDEGKTMDAYHSVSSAYELSETAFYDPSLVETLYFPDETKYAIYMPLFLPLAFPLAMSILRIGKYLLSSYLGGATARCKQSGKEKQH